MHGRVLHDASAGDDRFPFSLPNVDKPGAGADPNLVVLGGGIGQATGFLDAVRRELRHLAPVQPELRVSALGPDAVVDGCLAAGLDRAWELVTATPLPESPGAA